MDPHNPRYGESGAIYGQVYYSSGASENTQPKKGKHMSEIKLSTSHMNPTQLIDFVTKLIALMTPAPPKVPPIPGMTASLADLTPKLAAAKAANDAYEQAKAGLTGLKTARDTAAATLGDELGLTAKAAGVNSKGEAASLQAAGFDIVASTHNPAPALAQLLNVALAEGPAPGSVNATCNPDPNASTYEWQTTAGDAVNGPYATFRQTTAAKVTITGLPSGSRVWVRVRAIGTKGEGPWSDPATRIVP